MKRKTFSKVQFDLIKKKICFLSQFSVNKEKKSKKGEIIASDKNSINSYKKEIICYLLNLL